MDTATFRHGPRTLFASISWKQDQAFARYDLPGGDKVYGKGTTVEAALVDLDKELTRAECFAKDDPQDDWNRLTLKEPLDPKSALGQRRLELEAQGVPFATTEDMKKI